MKKFKQSRQRLWSDKVFKDKMLQKMIGNNDFSQNKKEKKLEYVLNIILPNEYKFVGDGQIFISGLVPDFININGQKKIIELFGDYWHNRVGMKLRDRRKIFTYRKYGYKTLIIWEHELEELDKVKVKILEFNRIK